MKFGRKKYDISVAIAGNPNCGKTCIFNNLTGTVQSVGNYPGVTVEKKVGKVEHGGEIISIVDLPGTYSLTAFSMEEVVARNFLIEEASDVVLDIVDASNLERNLYLTVQLMELDAPLVIALNMMDLCNRMGRKVDTRKMSELLGVHVVPTIGSRNQGMKEILDAVNDVHATGSKPLSRLVDYGHEVEIKLARVTEAFANEPDLLRKYNPRWLAVKLLEKDVIVRELVRKSAKDSVSIFAIVDAAIDEIEIHYDDSSETIIAERRYGFAAGLVRECVGLTNTGKRDITDKIDAVVCSRIWGPVILAGVVYALFLSTFKLADEWKWIFGKSMTGWVETMFVQLSAMISGLGSGHPAIHSLLADGIIGGVGGVISFAPLIFCMFLFVAFLEDTGYVARIAFILDKALKSFGLQGKSILALIVSGGLGGGGCAVPGVMATRTLKEEKDRLITILVAPLMNCGAKMPVYMMLIAAFFAAYKAEMLFTLWILSWVFVLIAALFLRKFVVKGDQTPFVMELPTYHIPTFQGVLLHARERTWMYVKKAGTIILAINIVLWALMYFPRLSDEAKGVVRVEAAIVANSLVDGSTQADVNRYVEHQVEAKQLANSMAGRFGRALEPISQLAGFEWKTNIALIGGFAAKEVIVGVLGTAYSMGETDAEATGLLSERLAKDPDWNPVKAFAVMIFVMVYAPCFVTVSVIRRETGSWRWALFATAYSTTFAFILAVAIFRIGTIILA